jgi:SAM-dependent methyltransferase
MSSEEDPSGLPLPPIELRRTVGAEDPAVFGNPFGVPLFGDEAMVADYHAVLDFGCGCGRQARQMLLQRDVQPERYVGIDVHRPSIDWCNRHLSAAQPRFSFKHHDFWNPGLNPNGARREMPLPVFGRFTMVNAHSVFPHILEEHVRFHFEQLSLLLVEGGLMRVSWFLFDKRDFPMMQPFQNALYIQTLDPTNAVIYDVDFVKRLYHDCGITIERALAPAAKGNQWVLLGRRGASGPPLDFDIGAVAA